jgi:hypothetical protein
MTGQVQSCGCIALPEEFQARTGLYPGATFAIETAPDGNGLLIRTIQPKQPDQPVPGVTCGLPPAR